MPDHPEKGAHDQRPADPLWPEVVPAIAALGCCCRDRVRAQLGSCSRQALRSFWGTLVLVRWCGSAGATPRKRRLVRLIEFTA